MSKRREFTLSVDKEIRTRARNPSGGFRCENLTCGAFVKRGEVHHLKEDALEIDKSRKLTANDGKFLCIPCHKQATNAFAPIIAKVRKIEGKHLGAIRPSGKLRSRGFLSPPDKDRALTKITIGKLSIVRQYEG
jgi:hypothetical protein